MNLQKVGVNRDMFFFLKDKTINTLNNIVVTITIMVLVLSIITTIVDRL